MLDVVTVNRMLKCDQTNWRQKSKVYLYSQCGRGPSEHQIREGKTTGPGSGDHPCEPFRSVATSLCILGQATAERAQKEEQGESRQADYRRWCGEGGQAGLPGCPGTGPWAAGEKGHLGAMLAYMQAAMLRRCVAAPRVARAWLRAESPAYKEAEGYRSEKCTKSRAGSTFPTSILPTPRP